ncbi:hypothetical protein JMA_01270 [Jeotgalibacillus malaysiensis]|uniref:Uncharacterized protein n=1 Tax=Jeotgalibacillus malaysiensis TaxID=1508404 RepID=A0A0B5AN82_9BACL|nr:hypothetical protein JMA_01270 [Jeotgalibacillus malaysiensis]
MKQFISIPKQKSPDLIENNGSSDLLESTPVAEKQQTLMNLDKDPAIIYKRC